jgi:excisionase family DNA binding protein
VNDDNYGPKRHISEKARLQASAAALAIDLNPERHAEPDRGPPDDAELLVLDLWPDTARLCGVGKSKIYQMAAEGRLPIVKFGKRIKVLRRPLLRMLGAADAV